MMHIHFVCAGNIYRSRLAEAYIKSKQIPGLIVSSSGIEAPIHARVNGIVSWEAMRLIKHNHLIPFMKPLPEITTEKTLSQADLVVFFSEEYHTFVKENLHFRDKEYEIWSVADIEVDNDLERIQISEETFNIIKQKIDYLLDKLQKPY